MTYKLHYHITSVSYNEETRKTTVGIVNESTGEMFFGVARRHPSDESNLSLAINLATARAVREAAASDLLDEEDTIIRYCESSAFHL